MRDHAELDGARARSGHAMVGPSPSLSVRVWRRLGFRPRHPEVPEHVDLGGVTLRASALPGWMLTHVDLHVSLGDRLRLLVSGRARVRVETRSEREPGDAHSWSSFEVRRPGRRGAGALGRED